MAKRNKDSEREARMEIRMRVSLKEWVQRYAQDKDTTATQLVIDFFTELRNKTETGHVDQI